MTSRHLRSIVTLILLTLNLGGLEAHSQWLPFTFWKKLSPGLAFTTSGQTFFALNCSAIITVQSRNALGTPYNVPTNLTVNLSGTAGVAFYSDEGCTQEVTSVTINSGQNNTSFYIVSTSTGTQSVTANASGHNSAQQNHTLSANPFIWIGGVSNSWNDGANWSGGVGPNGTQTAIFNGDCVTYCSPGLSGTTYVGNLRVLVGYTGSIQQNNYVLGVNHWLHEAGTFNGGSANVGVNRSFTMTGGDFRLTSANTTVGWDFRITGYNTFDHNSGTLVFSHANRNKVYSPSDVLFHDVRFITGYENYGTLIGTMNVSRDLYIQATTGCCQTIDGGIIDVKRNVTLETAGHDESSTTIRLSGNGNQTVSSSGAPTKPAYPNVEIASTGGTVTFVGDQHFTKEFKYVSGTVSFGSTTSHFKPHGGLAGATYDYDFASPLAFHNVILNPTYDRNRLILGTMVVMGTLSGSFSMCCSPLNGGGTIEAHGNVDFTVGSSDHAGNSYLKLMGSTDTTLKLGGTLSAGQRLSIEKSGGAKVTMLSNVGVGGDGDPVHVVSGVLFMNGYNLTVNSCCSLPNNLIVDLGAAIYRGGGTINAEATINNGLIDPGAPP